jgi:glucose-6-phosphate 1-dehydrogenase
LGENDEMKGEMVEMIASRRPRPEEMEAYERILGDALSGDPTNFAREDYVEQAWRIVDPILKTDSAVYEYENGTWGPTQADQIVAPPGGWHNPSAADREDFRVAGQGA